MNKLLENQNKDSCPGTVDWIYWLEQKNRNSALVFQISEGEVYKQLELYFNDVLFITVNCLNELENDLINRRFGEFEFDLIFCTDLLSKLSGNTERIKAFLNQLDSILSYDGTIVFGYCHSRKLIESAIRKLMPCSSASDRLKIFNRRQKKNGVSKACIDYIRENKFCRRVETLYVYPRFDEPWTVSNSQLFAAKIYDWKKKTKRTAIFFRFIASKFGILTFKYWWPHRIIFISKKTTNAKSDII